MKILNQTPRILLAASVMAGMVCLARDAQANPGGMTVQQGSATTTVNGSQLNITVSQNTVLNWQSFNINAGETTTFIQPSSTSVVWNRIGDANPSQILGNLNANGFVVLMNANGFYFGKDSVVNVGGFLATSVPIMQSSGSVSPFWQYSGPPPVASIVNYGQISSARGGSVFLVAEKIENHGTIMAPDGTLGLYAGKEVLVTDRPDGRGLSAQVVLPEGSVDNTGKLIADAGSIAIHAKVVNQDGFIQADSVRETGGVIELVGTDAVNLGDASVIRAQGGSDGISKGGTISIKSDGVFSDKTGSQINVIGGSSGGDGGSVEICAPSMSLNSSLDARAQTGWVAGRLSIDPTDIILSTSGTGTYGGTVSSGDSPSALQLNVNTAFANFSTITLEATRDISLASGTVWNLNASTGVTEAGCVLTLEAGRNIVFNNNSKIVAGDGWSVNLAAGADFKAPMSVTPGVGGIYLNGGPASSSGSYPRLSGSVETTDGSIEMKAGNEIVVGSGYIRTSSGGGIDLTAVSGNVDAGQNKNSYVFSRNGADPNPAGVGGIATTAGGDVTITAGNQILSVLPTVGCYGAGSVTLTADTILGHYLVHNGVGKINARNVGSLASPVSLALSSGGWAASARENIYLNEVYNPNGSLNSSKQDVNGTMMPFAFDYAPDAYVTLTAGNSVQLLGNSLAHTTSNPDRPAIYPGRLTINAGAGGVVLGNDVVLYPSADASLVINTINGGSLRSTTDNSFRLIMSDSDSPDYTTFVDGHSSTPLQQASADDPARLNISGNIENIRLQIPKASEIFVGGDTLNFFYTGQNLLSSDVTKLTVLGNIRYRADYTTTACATTPDFSIFDPLVTTRPDLNFSTRIWYDAVNHQLVFNGRMTAAELAFLLNPTVYVYDVFGKQVFDAQGQPVTQKVSFVSSSLVQSLYAASQDVPTFPTKTGGLLIGGPGKYIVSAKSMDLGITSGIRSILTALNPNLAYSFSKGADVEVNLSGNLEMTASQIASFNGGSINITAGGTMDIGSQAKYTSDDTPKGIYSGNGGNVTVTAVGDVIINGSRIASYDGGDVRVTSTTGNVDAGSGAKGYFQITTMQLNPITGLLESRLDRFFGGGIVTLTRQDSQNVVGNIYVTAEKDILANIGGIMQLPLNRYNYKNAEIDLKGDNIRSDASGIIGINLNVEARGEVTGILVGQGDIKIAADKDVNVSVLGGGGVNINSSDGKVAGVIVASGDVSLAGSAITATAFSSGGSTSTSGDASGAKLGSFNGVAVQTGEKTSKDASETVAASSQPALTTDDDEKKKGGARPLLAKSTGRVTVILPKN